jgi:hypothetical protein
MHVATIESQVCGIRGGGLEVHHAIRAIFKTHNRVELAFDVACTKMSKKTDRLGLHPFFAKLPHARWKVYAYLLRSIALVEILYKAVDPNEDSRHGGGEAGILIHHLKIEVELAFILQEVEVGRAEFVGVLGDTRERKLIWEIADLYA